MASEYVSLSEKYRVLLVRRPWLMLGIGILITIFCALGLGGLSQNPDDRIFFSKNDPQLVALETLEKIYIN